MKTIETVHWQCEWANIYYMMSIVGLARRNMIGIAI